MGNPPFVGYSNQSAEQKADMLSIFVDEKGKPYKTAGKLDYVCAWYRKAADYVLTAKDTKNTKVAFVSTNSVCQGESVAAFLKPLFEMGLEIDFAWRTFRWDNEAQAKAHVHCVIVGFSFNAEAQRRRVLYVDGFFDLRLFLILSCPLWYNAPAAHPAVRTCGYPCGVGSAIDSQTFLVAYCD